jgi:hypothetical protein
MFFRVTYLINSFLICYNYQSYIYTKLILIQLEYVLWLNSKFWVLRFFYIIIIVIYRNLFVWMLLRNIIIYWFKTNNELLINSNCNFENVLLKLLILYLSRGPLLKK